MKHISSVILALLCAISFSLSAENYPYRSDALWITKPNHDNWLYETGEQATVDVEFLLYGQPVRQATISYTLGDDMLPDDTSGTAELVDGKATIPMGTMTRPGFRDLRLSLEKDGRKFTHHIKLGFSPEKLKPYVGCPADFDSFWAKALEEDRKFPLKYSVEDAPRYTTDRMTCQLVRLELPDDKSMYGYLFIPRGEGKFPAVLCPPGAGVKTIKEPLRHRYYGEGGMIRAEIEILVLHPELSEEEFAALRKA
ncbi:MAG: acetylxylan esterase, partial [Duncaniella sp.]|nr:acetylxylan esterase [Duncaniella sp.]